jgi:ABC-type sugar transport system ATPase subunit
VDLASLGEEDTCGIGFGVVGDGVEVSCKVKRRGVSVLWFSREEKEVSRKSERVVWGSGRVVS